MVRRTVYSIMHFRPLVTMTTRIARRTLFPLLAGLALPACAALRPGALSEGARDVAYGPNPRQRMDIYVPKGGGDGPKPVVFFIYGGSWANGDKETYSFVGDALAARGFVTVIADYRLVPEVRFPSSSRTARWPCGRCATPSPAMAAPRTAST